MLQRECEFGLGFMTNLVDHRFGVECSPESFGHSGNVGSSFAFADPERHLAVAVIFNGIVDQDEAAVEAANAAEQASEPSATEVAAAEEEQGIVDQQAQAAAQAEEAEEEGK